MKRGKIYWFTGLSGAGKTTVAKNIQLKFNALDQNFVLLDGDVLRTGLCSDLNFSIEDRKENIRRVAEVSRLFSLNGSTCLCTFISPTKEIREMAKNIIGEEFFHEIHINTPLSVCEERDTKGLYKQARAGEIKDFTGIDSVYEIPESPDYVLDCTNSSLDESTNEMIQYIKKTED